eukprot:s39_g11.t1
MYEAYKKKFGDVPSPESEPTSDQLAAVKQLLGSGAAPYIDFSVYGPHGLRLLRRLTFQAISLNSQGEWQRKELPGPPDHESWAEIYRVVRTTFLLLETMTAERMDAYAEHIRSLSSRFGKHCWDLVYTADVHMRSEQFERIRRRLQSNPEHGYTEASPWNAVLAQAIREDAFWSREVITPATLRLAQSRSIPAPLSALDKTGVSLDAEPEREPKKSKKRKAKEIDDKSKHDGKCFTHNRRGMEICANWNQGRCGKSPKPQGVAGAPAAASQRRISGAAAKGSADARSRSRSPLKRNPKLQRPPEPGKPPPGKPVAKRPPARKPAAKDDEAPGLTAKAAPATPASAAKATSSTAQSSSQQFFKGTSYGCWTHDPDKLAAKPRCLHLFAGPARQGDVADQLTKLGWAVCSCDTKQPIPTNLLDQATRAAILQDITDQVYDAVFLGTPCETYSALRETPPGPRPLRSAEEIMGKSTGLNDAEKKQLAEGNQHTEFSADVMQTAHKSYTPFTMENPEPIYPVSIFNTPRIGEVAKLRNVRAVDFDQCRVGCEAKKPTRLLRYRIEYSGLGGLRCNHEPKTFKDADGNEYKAPHEKVVARRRTTPDGKSEYASKALGNYHKDFCQVIAKAISKVNMERATKMRELHEQGSGRLGWYEEASRGSEEVATIPRTWCRPQTTLGVCPEQIPYSLSATAKGILEGSDNIPEFEEEPIRAVMSAVGKLLEPSEPLPAKTTVATSPLKAELIWGWGEMGDDPDAKTLAGWIQGGAPLGFEDQIPTTGVFPRVTGTPADAPTDAELARPFEDWSNWPSADEEHDSLVKLVREAEAKGFCQVTPDLGEVQRNLGGSPVLNKLGVIVKLQGENQDKKARIIWDLRESKVNEKCNPAERVTLPRLLDVVADGLKAVRSEGQLTWVAVDIKDAFHNIPAGADRRYTVASAPMEDGEKMYIVYNVLVFGAKSSPTIWGRYAALLGRILACTVPENKTHIYVDDPILCIPATGQEAVHLLSLSLLCMRIFGYPLKLSKAAAGETVKWIGAQLTVGLDTDGRFIKVNIPQDKVEKLLAEAGRMLKAPVVGTKQLQSFAGGMAFVAGLVPVLRPFLSPLWAALAKVTAHDSGPKTLGSRAAGKLIHVKRIAHSLNWIKALLQNEHGDLERRFDVDIKDDGWEIITDACPWGMGGVLYHNKAPKRWYSSPLPPEVLEKFGATAGDPGFNTAWEALALLVALRLWLTRCPRTLAVRVKSDNVGALRMLLKLTSQSGSMAVIAREIALDIAAKNYQLNELHHVPGVTNVVADALSRLWAPHPEPFPFLGEAVRDEPPRLDDSFWKVV